MNNYNSSLYTEGVLLVWKDYFKLKYIRIKDSLLFKGVDWEGSEVYFYPLGPNDQEIVTLIPKNSKVIYIPEERANQFNSDVIKEMQDDFDYVYDFKDFLSLTGKDKSSARNHINSFKKNNPSFEYRIIDKNSINDAITILKLLDLTDEYKILERVYNLHALNEYFNLSFIGYILYANSKPVAFSIGEIIKDTVYIQFEKNLHFITGSGDMNRHLFLEHLQEYNLKFINREEDAGDLGLRTSKMRLGPIKFIRKYSAITN